jgi:hypothetical protein
VVGGQPLLISYTVKVFDPGKSQPQPQPQPQAGELTFATGPVIARRDGSHHSIRKGVRLVVRAKVSGGAVTAYKWLRDGRGIAKATGRTYRVRAADRGHRLSCRVTAAAVGGAKLVRKAPSVAVARR